MPKWDRFEAITVGLAHQGSVTADEGQPGPEMGSFLDMVEGNIGVALPLGKAAQYVDLVGGLPAPPR
jgi:hypothetical protein